MADVRAYQKLNNFKKDKKSVDKQLLIYYNSNFAFVTSMDTVNTMLYMYQTFAKSF